MMKKGRRLCEIEEELRRDRELEEAYLAEIEAQEAEEDHRFWEETPPIPVRPA